VPPCIVEPALQLQGSFHVDMPHEGEPEEEARHGCFVVTKAE